MNPSCPPSAFCSTTRFMEPQSAERHGDTVASGEGAVSHEILYHCPALLRQLARPASHVLGIDPRRPRGRQTPPKGAPGGSLQPSCRVAMGRITNPSVWAARIGDPSYHSIQLQ